MIINRNKSIGHVLFIVEGSRFEFNLLKQVFVTVLGYRLISKRRNGTIYLQGPINSTSIVAILNTETSNISSMKDKNGFLDALYAELITKYKFNIQNATIYYLFDRDRDSNTNCELIEELIYTFQNARENKDNMLGGLLLLSYPSIEAYEYSNFIVESYKIGYKLGSELKVMINKNAKLISLNKINEETILNAANELFSFIFHNNIPYELDNFVETSMMVYKIEEAIYENEGVYKLLSLFSYALIDLGIITDD